MFHFTSTLQLYPENKQNLRSTYDCLFEVVIMTETLTTEEDR